MLVGTSTHDGVDHVLSKILLVEDVASDEDGAENHTDELDGEAQHLGLQQCKEKI